MITIKISGPRKSGKTHIATFLAKALVWKGYYVDIVEKSEEGNTYRVSSYNSECEIPLIQEIKIEIENKQSA